MYIPLDQLEIARKSGLGFAEQDFKPPRLRRMEHCVEARAAAVGARIILVRKNRADLPSLLRGIIKKQGFLVLDAFGFLLLFSVLFA